MVTPRSGFQDEMDLLMSMYPEEISYNQRSSDLSFKHQKGKLCLRIPSNYPSDAKFEVISAAGPSKTDIRDAVMAVVRKQENGESCLDAVIAEFMGLVESMASDGEKFSAKEKDVNATAEDRGKTVVIWLHHLLATSKRKQALSLEGTSASLIRGVTKPGYPGVLIFSGPEDDVNSHVQTLKHLRWQAFQVRYETGEVWKFKHGDGIVEVETMGAVVEELELIDGGKDVFMEAMKMK